MKTALAILTASLIFGAAAATVAVVAVAGDEESRLSFLARGDGAGADEHMHHGGEAGDHAHAQIGMARPTFAPAAGTVPTAEAAASLEEVSHLYIYGDEGFRPSNGISKGSGTMDDPFLITGYYVTGDLYFGDTDACFEVKENYIAGQLSLNWNGQCVFVHHNHIDDLRVNENIRRDGFATGGLIEANVIEFIGQLRHYDGEVRNNIVGPRTTESVWDEVLEETPLFSADILVANVDGFNQGLIHHNTFYGPVELDLHGHHHGTGFFAPHSHYHGMDANHTPDHMEDHTDRWTSVSFTDNKIVDEVGYGLRYQDADHAGDDRTARSEDNESLELNHTHRTLVELSRNVIAGGQIRIDIFNADDKLHYARNDGWLNIMDNTITMKERAVDSPVPLFGPFFFGRHEYVPNVGIMVHAAKEFDAVISGNKIEFVAQPKNTQDDPLAVLDEMFGQHHYDIDPAAIRLEYVKDSNILIENTQAKGFYYGIYAHDLDNMTAWTLVGNTFEGSNHEVYYDESVANRPEQK